jgi:hypothetical protein
MRSLRIDQWSAVGDNGTAKSIAVHLEVIMLDALFIIVSANFWVAGSPSLS